MVSTPFQTIGPFFNPRMLRPGDNDLTRAGANGTKAAGDVIDIGGCVMQADGTPINCALVEIWQADAEGRYAGASGEAGSRDAGFKGFGRALTRHDGRYSFRTVKPGSVAGPGNAPQAPHILVSVFAAGLLRRVVTRIYFPDEPLNESDPVLGTVDDPAARETLFAVPQGDRSYSFDIVLRGERQTAFFTD